MRIRLGCKEKPMKFKLDYRERPMRTKRGSKNSYLRKMRKWHKSKGSFWKFCKTGPNPSLGELVA